MGVFPEPARCADDVGGLMLATTIRTRRQGRSRATCALALGLLAGFGLPQAAIAPAFFAPAAQAHDRIETSPKTETALIAAPPTEARSAWNGLPLPEQDPPTTALIADNLAALPRVTQEAGEDAVRFGQRSVPLKVVDTIVKASEEAGVDPVYMMALADKALDARLSARRPKPVPPSEPEAEPDGDEAAPEEEMSDEDKQKLLEMYGRDNGEG